MDIGKHFSLFRSSRSCGEGLFLEEVKQTDDGRNEQESFGQKHCDGAREAKVWTSQSTTRGRLRTRKACSA